MPGPWVWVVATGVVAVWLGFGLGMVADRLWWRSRTAPAHSPSPAPAPGPDPPVQAGDLHGTLVAGLIATHDLSGTNNAVRKHVEQVLRRVGVVPVQPPPGTLFDPEFHNAVDAQPAAEGVVSNTIAGLVRPGWSRGPEVIRVPEVVVWT